MFPACEDFRLSAERRLEESSAVADVSACLDELRLAGGHGASCAECGLWLERRRRSLGHLGSLARFSAPAELDELLARSLSSAGHARTPSASASDDLAPSQTAGLLAGLERQVAPSVLDRLVSEELADPAAARVRRFVGDMERPEAPRGLAGRLRLQLAGQAQERRDRALSDAGRRSWTRALSSVGLLAAAAMLFWLRPGAGTEAAPPAPNFEGFSFTVREASHPSELSAMTLALVGSQSGAILGQGVGRVRAAGDSPVGEGH